MPKYITDGRWHSNDDMTVFRLTSIEELLEQICDILITEHKKSAPPRNCDRFNSGDPAKDAADAYDEWQRYCDVSPMPPSCKVESAFKQWLFASAEGKAKCRGCEEYWEDVRKRNCFHWNPSINKCTLDKPSCRISCGDFHVVKEEKPDPAEGGAE